MNPGGRQGRRCQCAGAVEGVVVAGRGVQVKAVRDPERIGKGQQKCRSCWAAMLSFSGFCLWQREEAQAAMEVKGRCGMNGTGGS